MSLKKKEKKEEEKKYNLISRHRLKGEMPIWNRKETVNVYKKKTKNIKNIGQVKFTYDARNTL